MRLFIAIEIPPEIRATFAALLKEFRAVAPQVKWVRPENLHVTLKFLGEAETAKLSALQNALSAIRSHQPVNLEFRGLGFFPSEQRPRVLWMGIAGSQELESLAAGVDRALYKIGIPPEQRAFQPHLTLARFDPPGMNLVLRAAIGRNIDRVFGSLHAYEFHLIESKLKPSGAEYTTLQSFPFAEAEA